MGNIRDIDLLDFRELTPEDWRMVLDQFVKYINDRFKSLEEKIDEQDGE